MIYEIAQIKKKQSPVTKPLFNIPNIYRQSRSANISRNIRNGQLSGGYDYYTTLKCMPD